MVTVTVVGARGYLGREALRILHNHPKVDGLNAVSLSGEGGRFKDSVPAFNSHDLPLKGPDETVIEQADVIFFATAAGQAKEIADRLGDNHPLLVDLSRDHRLQALANPRPGQAQTVAAGQSGGTSSQSATTTQAAPWVYALPETPLNGQQGDTRIANPGCYPTASLLSLLPAVTAGLTAAGPLIVDGKSGVSGAGATPRADLHYTEVNENIRAYKVVGHDHGDEIEAAVARIGGQDPQAGTLRHPVRFTPHLVPMNRGLLSTSYIPVEPGVTETQAREVYEQAYQDASTVSVVDEPATANVKGTVRAELAVDLDPRSQMLVVRTAIDNLCKGGSGQGVHNMNVALGYEPTLGLPLLGGNP